MSNIEKLTDKLIEANDRADKAEQKIARLKRIIKGLVCKAKQKVRGGV